MLALAIVGASHASAIMVVAGSVTITGGLPTGIDAGDQFAFAIAYDEFATDTSGTTATGLFPNSIPLGTTLTRIGGTGSWDPAGGLFSTGTVVTGSDIPDDFMMFSIMVNSGFPQIGGTLSFTEMVLHLHTFNLSAVNDLGGGQPLIQLLNGLPAELVGWTSQTAELRFGDTQSERTLTASGAVTLVPEPASSLLLVAGAGLWGGRRRRRA
jgi:PEP-CTERM motif